jgi:hypothetical protein
MLSLLKKQIVLQEAGALTNYIVLHIAFLFCNMSCPYIKPSVLLGVADGTG